MPVGTGGDVLFWRKGLGLLCPEKPSVAANPRVRNVNGTLMENIIPYFDPRRRSPDKSTKPGRSNRRTGNFLFRVCMCVCVRAPERRRPNERK